MFSTTLKIILSTISCLICISMSNEITDDEFSPIVEFLLNASSENDCFFIVGPISGPNERIGSFRLLLSAHSKPLREILQGNEVSDNGDIALPDVEPKTFKDFLICLYGGCDVVLKKLSFEECGKLLSITEKYFVTQLKNKLIPRLLEFSPLKLDDLFTALSNPVYFNNEELNKVFADQLYKHTKDIFDDERFVDLDEKALLIIVKQEPIIVPEIIVWEAILKWGKHNTNSTDGKIVREKINSLLEFIRFCSMDLKEFYKSVVPANVLTPEEVIDLSISLANNQCHNISGLSKESQSRYVPQNVKQEQITYLHYYVKNVTELKEGEWYYSEPVELGEFSWEIMIMKSSTYLQFYIHCKQSHKVKEKSSWEIRATKDYILVNQNGYSNKQYHTVSTYNIYSKSWGYKSFIGWNGLIDPYYGYIKDNHILLLARVKLNPKE